MTEIKKIVPSPSDPQFLTGVVIEVLHAQADHPLVSLFDLENEIRLSFLFDFSGIQESFRFRSVHRARRLAWALLDEKGEFKKKIHKEISFLYEKEGRIFYPEGGSDSLIYEHTQAILSYFHEEKILQLFKRFQKPLCHKAAEEMVLEALGIYEPTFFSDVHLRAAVLSACLTPLRQNVGSCFATAPAILIQRDQLELFLEDLYQLLSTGKLKRTFGGVEYALPLSPSSGMGDLKKNLLTSPRAWYCPGLMAAIEQMGLFSSAQNFEEKGKRIQEEIQKAAEGKKSLSSEEWIRYLLMQKHLLTPNDLEQQKHWELSQFKMAKLLNQGLNSMPSGKWEAIQLFRKQEKAARAAFKGICDNALLKSWEFTLASFSEVKMEFSRWNLYSSLGFAPEEPGGIGELIYRQLEEKIEKINKQIEEYQKQYEIAFDEVRTTEALLRNAYSESDARRLQAEYQARAYHLRACLEMRDKIYAKGSHYTSFFSFLTSQYDQKFPEYFQEIYDAEMQDIQGEIYEDSPAGFRLVYKHGRSDPSLWTLIYDAEQYIESLVEFFHTTESEIASSCEWEGGREEVLEATSRIISHLREREFLETALQRMAKAHDLSVKTSAEKKPWAYTSGGTMTTLLKTYYCRESEFSQEEKWVESETELLIFILDSLKNLPHRITDPFLKKENLGMLISSPSHAFILLPGAEKLKEGWQEELFSYTWVRDTLFQPSRRFYTEMSLNPAEQQFLFDQWTDVLQVPSREFSREEKNRTIPEWRILALQEIPLPKEKISEKIDSFLFQSLPIIDGKRWKSLVRLILSDQMNEKVDAVLQKFPDRPAPFLTAKQLLDATKGCYLLAEKKTTLSFDLHLFTARQARFVGTAPPTPLLFADTNWAHYFFGFVVNPSSGKFELWRLDKALSRGAPMSSWKVWLTGAERKSWTIYTHPHEYLH